MSTPLDMSLDEVIKSSRGNGNRERVRERGRTRRGRGRGPGPRGSFSGGGRMTGLARWGPLSVHAQPSPYAIAKASTKLTKNFPWRHDLFEDSIRAAGIAGIEIGTKLYVSNLDYGVTNEDIRELFSEIGGLKRYAVHYDKTGRPSGSAEVVYTRRSDAFAALKRYNNVLLDGKPMKLEVVGTNAEVPISARVNVAGVNGRKKRTVVMTSGPGRVGGPAVVNRGSGNRDSFCLLFASVIGFSGQRGRAGPRNGRGGPRSGGGSGGGGGGGGGGGRGRGRGRGRTGSGGRGKKKPVEKSADELDKELDNYHAEAMQTS
ncbi:hypothetical protein TIFTF001_002066 [Ficus carica]|uniref:RRM domain-containing protein n=1 Tax=Ficus carica TaxID=3494 RepID=A0AA87ZBK1_FICCA|nr:hypothetical protein TIFTF001_002066 [Ficus carica]